MMVVGIAQVAEDVAVAPVAVRLGMYPLQEAKLHQQIERAKDGGAPNVRCRLRHPVEKFGGGERCTLGGYLLKHGLPGRGGTMSGLRQARRHVVGQDTCM